MTEMMVERVARAMQARRMELIDRPLSRCYGELARAAIEAMKGPTHKMLHAAKQTWWPDGTIVYDYGIDNEDMAKAFDAMIDSALSETEGG